MNKKENKAIRHIEDTYMTDARKNIYIALENFDFIWSNTDVMLVIRMYNDGIHIDRMSEVLERDSDEIAILIIDLARSGLIEKRESGIYGTYA